MWIHYVERFMTNNECLKEDWYDRWWNIIKTQNVNETNKSNSKLHKQHRQQQQQQQRQQQRQQQSNYARFNGSNQRSIEGHQ